MTGLITVMNSIFEYLIGLFGTVFSTITGNPVLYLPVLLALVGSAIFYVISLVRRFGVRGAGGGRRKRRR